MEVADMSTTIPPSSSDSFWIPSSLHGPASMANFEGLQQETAKESPRLGSVEKEETTSSNNEDFQFHQPEKKRRLSPDQLHFLEKSFEVENKLEPERKIHLAQKLGLHPKQVAIWFQNRRARYRTKRIEKEFDSLKASFDKLSADFDSVSKENEQLRHEVELLKAKLKAKEKADDDPKMNSFEGGEAEPEKQRKQSIFTIKTLSMRDASSAKSDVLDSDSPLYSSFMEPAHSSHVFESDFSQEEDDSLCQSLFPTLFFPKLEDHHLDHDLHIPASSCNLGFSISDQSPWFWSSGLVD